MKAKDVIVIILILFFVFAFIKMTIDLMHLISYLISLLPPAMQKRAWHFLAWLGLLAILLKFIEDLLGVDNDTKK